VEEHTFKESDGVKEEIRHFIRCIRGEEEPLCDGIEGRKSLKVALAVLESIREKKIVEIK